MSRAAASSDVFNAIGESSRRDILAYLAPRERAVGELVRDLRIPQPSVSKHLKVLHSAGLVNLRRAGRNVFYQTNPSAIRPIHEWAATFEAYWTNQLLRVKERAERIQTDNSGETE